MLPALLRKSSNERRAAELVRDIAPQMLVTTSHETLPVWREFERFNTDRRRLFGPAVDAIWRSSKNA